MISPNTCKNFSPSALITDDCTLALSTHDDAVPCILEAASRHSVLTPQQEFCRPGKAPHTGDINSAPVLGAQTMFRCKGKQARSLDVSSKRRD